MTLTVENLAFGYRGRRIGEKVAFTLAPGEALCLLGPNGTGKTTLFKTLLGLIPPLEGRVLVDGAPLHGLSARARARKLAYAPQAHAATFPFTALDIVTMGRAAHLGPLAAPGPADRARAHEHLARFGMAHLAQRPFGDLSGGERQIVLIARALMQEAAIVVLDEPTASLDYGNQVKVLGAIRGLAASGLSVLFSTHSPDHAFLCADRVALLDGGTLAAIGRPAEVLTPAALKALYRIDVAVGTLPGHPTPVCAPVMPADFR